MREATGRSRNSKGVQGECGHENRSCAPRRGSICHSGGSKRHGRSGGKRMRQQRMWRPEFGLDVVGAARSSTGTGGELEGSAGIPVAVVWQRLAVSAAALAATAAILRARTRFLQRRRRVRQRRLTGAVRGVTCSIAISEFGTTLVFVDFGRQRRGILNGYKEIILIAT